MSIAAKCPRCDRYSHAGPCFMESAEKAASHDRAMEAEAECARLRAELAELRAASASIAGEVRERCAKVAEFEGYSVIDLDEKKGPFTIQDEATNSCCKVIAERIRKMSLPTTASSQVVNELVGAAQALSDRGAGPHTLVSVETYERLTAAVTAARKMGYGGK